MTSLLTHDLAFKVEPDKYLHLVECIVDLCDMTSCMNSILTYDLAFKVEPEQCLCLD